jgi:hypothetical protein
VGTTAAEVAAGCDDVSLILMTNFFFLGWSSSSSSLQSLSSPVFPATLVGAGDDFCDAESPNMSAMDGCETAADLTCPAALPTLLLSEVPNASELDLEKGAAAAAEEESGLDFSNSTSAAARAATMSEKSGPRGAARMGAMDAGAKDESGAKGAESNVAL